MLATDDARHDIGGDPRLYLNRATWAFDQHPLLILDSKTQGRFRMNVGTGLRRRFAQPWEGPLLCVHVGRKFCVGHYEWKIGSDIRAADRTKRRLDIFR